MWEPMFWKYSHLAYFFYPEHEGCMFFKIIGTCAPNYTVPVHQTTQCLCTKLHSTCAPNFTVPVHQTTRSHIPEHHNINSHCCENFKLSLLNCLCPFKARNVFICWWIS
jgi:hypothetical protein